MEPEHLHDNLVLLDDKGKEDQQGIDKTQQEVREKSN
jgi:hypothetical protein